jgi:hypothetical protein
VAAVEDGRQAHTGRQGLDHVMVDLIVNDVACCLKVERVNDLVMAVLLVAVKVLCLSAVACSLSASFSPRTVRDAFSLPE